MLKRNVLTVCAIVCCSLAVPRQSEACLFSWLFGCHSCFRPVAVCPSPCSTTACSPCATSSCSPCSVSGSCATGDCNISTYVTPESSTYTAPQSDNLETTWKPGNRWSSGMQVSPYGPAPVIVRPVPQPAEPEEAAPALTLPDTEAPVAVRQRTAPKTSLVRPASVRSTSIRTTSVNEGWIPVGP